MREADWQHHQLRKGLEGEVQRQKAKDSSQQARGGDEAGMLHFAETSQEYERDEIGVEEQWVRVALLRFSGG